MSAREALARILIEYPELCTFSLPVREAEPGELGNSSLGYCNPREIVVDGTLSRSMQEFVLLHELLHVALRHPWRALKYPPLVVNLAADALVNALLSDIKVCGKLLEFPEGVVLPETLGLSRKEVLQRSLEELCELLLQRLQQQPQSLTGGGKQASPVDDHEAWEEWNTTSPPEEELKPFLERLRRQIGTSAAELETEIEVGIVPPDLQLQQKVREMLARTSLGRASERRIIDWDVPDRRGNLPSVWRYRTGRVVVHVDTSSSMWNERDFEKVGEILAALRPFKYTLICGDVELKNVSANVRPGTQVFKLVGGGGTSHEWLEKIQFSPSVIVCITDGETVYPKGAPAPVLWILPEDGKEPPFGEVIRWKGWK